MKPLKQPDFSKTIIVSQTPRQQLIQDLLSLNYTHMNVSFEAWSNRCNDILSKYDVGISELTSVITEIPQGIKGKTIVLNYHPDESSEQIFKGEILKVLYRDTAYDTSIIESILEHPDMSEEQKSLIRMNIFEEIKPKIYHRLVLNDEKQGILIIPLLRGITIEQE